MIKVERIYAVNEDNLQQELNRVVGNGRLVSVEYQHDDWHQIIYQTTE